jgi:hypothetical protein
MEKLSIPSIYTLAEVITGDNQISPYRTRTQLEELFKHLQINTTQFRKLISRTIGARRGNTQRETVWVNENSERLSRKDFTKGILQTLDLDKIILIINEILDYRYYSQGDYKLDKTVEILNNTLKEDKLEIIQIDNIFKCRRFNQQWLHDNEVFKQIDSHYVLEQVNKCKEKIENEDYSGAITNARTLVEAVLKELIKQLGKEDLITSKISGDLGGLYKIVQQSMILEPNKDLDTALNQILSGLSGIVSGLAGVSNKLGDRHATKYKTHKHHALLMVYSANTLCEFLISSYEYQQSKKL